MKLSKSLVLTFLTFVVALVLYATYQPGESEHVHDHAGFVVYIDGVKQDYSNYKYMNFVPCSEHDTKKSKVEEQIEKAHLHDSVGDVVHTHRSGAVWGDLFTNIQALFPDDKPMRAYVDGREVANIMETSITPYSSVVITYGSSDDPTNLERVSLEHIKEVEAKSELCGTN